MAKFFYENTTIRNLFVKKFGALAAERLTDVFLGKSTYPSDYKKKLQAQKRFNYYYGCFSRKYLKIQIKAAKNKRKSFGEKSWILSKIFISLFERRLDTVLYRSQFVLTIKQARQLISHKHIKINGKVVNISSYLVQKGDLIDLIPKKKAAITLNEIKNPIWPVPEKHLQVNYRTYQIIFVGNLEANSFETSFFFHLELKNVLNYYK